MALELNAMPIRMVDESTIQLLLKSIPNIHDLLHLSQMLGEVPPSGLQSQGNSTTSHGRGRVPGHHSHSPNWRGYNAACSHHATLPRLLPLCLRKATKATTTTKATPQIRRS